MIHMAFSSVFALSDLRSQQSPARTEKGRAWTSDVVPKAYVQTAITGLSGIPLIDSK